MLTVLCPFVLFCFKLIVHIYQEWSKEEYPTYANGPGYIISSDIAHFIVSNFKKHRLKVRLQLSLLDLSLIMFAMCV